MWGMGRVFVACICLMSIPGAISLSVDKIHHKHHTKAAHVDSRREAQRRLQANKLEMLTVFYSAKQKLDSQFGEIDLEMYKPVRYEKRIYDFLFNVLEPISGDLVHEQGAADGAVTLKDVYAYLGLITRLPPIRKVSEAIERFATFAGGEDKTEITPAVLKNAYQELFDLSISDKEAQEMVSSLILNHKVSKDETPKISRCEFVVGSLRRNFLTDETLKGTGKLWNSKKLWTVQDLAYELGYDEDDGVGQKLMDRIFLTIDFEHPGPKDEQNTHYLTFCEMNLAVGSYRSNLFRNFFSEDEPEQAKPGPEHEFEEFRGKSIFAHDPRVYVKEREHKAKRLQDLFHTCDGNGDNALNRQEFTCFMKAIDVWQDLVPSIEEITDSTPVKSFDSNRVWDKLKFSGLKTVTDKNEFDRIWTHVAGEKSLYMTSAQWDHLQVQFGKRLGQPLEGSNSYKYVELPSFTVGADVGGMQRLFKEEVQNAWFGQPVFFPGLDEDQTRRTVNLLNPSREISCDRSCWTVLSPLMSHYAKLDENFDGDLTVGELRGLGVVTLQRLAKYPSLTSEEIPVLHAAILEETKQSKFRLPEFASLFEQDGVVSIESFLDPPKLKETRVAA